MKAFAYNAGLRLAQSALLPVSLDAASSGCAATPEAQLDYMQFCQAAIACPPGLAGHLSASAFLRLRRGSGGAVSVAAVLAYLGRRAAMLQLWQHLVAFDAGGRGALSAAELEHAIVALAEELPGLSGAERHLPLPLYATVAARKLLFLHGRRGRVKIRDLVLSPVMTELLQLPPAVAAVALNDANNSPTVSSATGKDPRTESTATLAAEAATAVSMAPEADIAEDASWFAPATAARLVQLYSGLDADGQGLIPDDLVRFSSGSLTTLFVTRVFEEHATGNRNSNTGSSLRGHMHMGNSAVQEDVGTTHRQLQLADAVPRAMPQLNSAGPQLGLIDFLDFLLAWEHRGTPQALRYFWPVLDLRRQGHLSRADVAAFFREVHALWLDRGQYADLRIGDVVEEVFDLAAPSDPQKITLSDLQRCGAGGDIVGILADVAAFWEHDSKEALLAGDAAAHEEVPQLGVLEPN